MEKSPLNFRHTTMTFIFWQNALCILHSAFLRNLAETHKVILVSEVKMDPMRINQGFYIPDYGKVQMIVSPDENTITDLLKLDAIHIISGVQAFKLPSTAFKIAVKKNLITGIFSEPFNWMGIKGKLRFIKYWLFRVRYSKHIRFILTTGKRGRWCFESVGFKKSIIYDWAYFTETHTVAIHENQNKELKLLFIGSIDARKNILRLISVCKKLGCIDNLNIIGTGPLENELQQAIKNTKCNYMGKVPNQEIHKIIAESDVLILPSIYDGWGAVVNEALMCGTPVIASNNCGSSILLQGVRGRVFSIEKDNFEEILQGFLAVLPYDINKRKEIKNWALQNISGERAAKYFDAIIQHVLKKTSQRPVTTWLS
jgi:glycosyltransferase involved in cell wall biosynthesis